MHERHDDWTCHLQRRRRTEQPRVARRPNMHAKREKSLRPTCQSAMRGTHVSQARRTTRYRRRQAGRGRGPSWGWFAFVCVCGSSARTSAHRSAAPVPRTSGRQYVPTAPVGGTEPGAGWMAIRVIKMPRQSVCLSHASSRYPPQATTLLVKWSSVLSDLLLSFPASSFLARGRSAWTTSAPLPCHRGYAGRTREPLPRPATSAARAYGTRGERGYGVVRRAVAAIFLSYY